jgi:drug/metabolite transporter superfamily protein YnfA
VSDVEFYLRNAAFGSLLIAICLAWSWIVNKARS